MKKQYLGLSLLLFSFVSVSSVTAQKAATPAKTPKPIIFAVLNDGLTLEPIAHVNKGKFEMPVNGSDDLAAKTAFSKNYFKKGTVYKLVFGGANVGTATVKNADPQAECSSNMATSITKTSKTLLKGLVMALATNAPIKSTTSFRRKPATAEKDEIEVLVRAEYAKQKLTPKVLRYQNLTALDLDNDGTAEFVGSYWVEIDKLTRGLLFFIAGKGTSGKYSIGYSEYQAIDQSKVMSGEIKAVDDGVYHELLLDVFDYDGDGTREVFTYIQSFEGAGFNAYRRNGNKWTRVFEGSNYHCGY
jgi:hypothetical protein